MFALYDNGSIPNIGIQMSNGGIRNVFENFEDCLKYAICYTNYIGVIIPQNWDGTVFQYLNRGHIYNMEIRQYITPNYDNFSPVPLD